MRDNGGKNLDLVRKHARQLVRELDVIKSGYMDSGLSLSQCHVLFELAADKSLNQSQLVDRLLIDKSNLSRNLKRLLQLGLVKSVKDRIDSRQKFFSLTADGKKKLKSVVNLAEAQIGSALSQLTDEQQQTVEKGLRLLETALRHDRLQAGYTIRPIKKKDNPEMATIIRTVMSEFGAVGDGYSINDPEVDDMFGNYKQAGRNYQVIVNDDGRVVGGGGFARLVGGNSKTCELRKMYFLPELRGIGIGRRLLRLLLKEATQVGYRKCYIETLKRMAAANRFYIANGFKSIEEAMGNTGHCSCDQYFVKELKK